MNEFFGYIIVFGLIALFMWYVFFYDTTDAYKRSSEGIRKHHMELSLLNHKYGLPMRAEEWQEEQRANGNYNANWYRDSEEGKRYEEEYKAINEKWSFK
jgi:hypothetical protein